MIKLLAKCKNEETKPAPVNVYLEQSGPDIVIVATNGTIKAELGWIMSDGSFMFNSQNKLNLERLGFKTEFRKIRVF